MKFNKVKDSLPPLDKSYRCLAKVWVDAGERCQWSGFADVCFNATTGWRYCVDKNQANVTEWVLMEEVVK